MRILTFTNGCYLKKCIQVKCVMSIVFMLMFSHSSFSEEKFEPLDKEFLEFLSLYEIDDEELLTIAFDPDADEQESLPEAKGEQ